MGKKEEIEARLEELRAKEKEIVAERHAIYKASREAPEEEKVVPDWLADDALEGFGGFIQYPIQVNGIGQGAQKVLQPPLIRKDTKWVKIRTVHEEHEGKTFLGILLGDLASSATAVFNPQDGILTIGVSGHNPAIYVPDLHRVIMGYESWWGPVEGPEDLHKITDATIDNIWYVRALKDMGDGTSPDEAAIKALEAEHRAKEDTPALFTIRAINKIKERVAAGEPPPKEELESMLHEAYQCAIESRGRELEAAGGSGDSASTH